MQLRDKHIWITGASRGIGLAMAQQAASSGAALVVLSGRSATKLDEAVSLCSAVTGAGKVVSLCFDIGKASERQQAAAQYMRQFGRLDVMVHNAGISQRATMLQTEIAVERHLLEVNYWGAVELTKLVLPQMLNRKRCYIGVTSSVTGLFGVPLRTTYCASKHALHGYFMALQSEYHRHGLRVTLLCPGKINTSISKSALTGDGTPLGIVEKGHQRGISAAHCAAIFWRALRRGRLLCYAVRYECLAIILHRLSPQLGSALIRKVLPLPEAGDS